MFRVNDIVTIHSTDEFVTFQKGKGTILPGTRSFPDTNYWMGKGFYQVLVHNSGEVQLFHESQLRRES